MRFKLFLVTIAALSAFSLPANAGEAGDFECDDGSVVPDPAFCGDGDNGVDVPEPIAVSLLSAAVIAGGLKLSRRRRDA